MVDMTSLVNNSFSNVTGSHKAGLEPKILQIQKQKRAALILYLIPLLVASRIAKIKL